MRKTLSSQQIGRLHNAGFMAVGEWDAIEMMEFARKFAENRGFRFKVYSSGKDHWVAAVGCWEDETDADLWEWREKMKWCNTELLDAIVNLTDWMIDNLKMPLWKI